jgi:hypothetical protein
VGYQIIPLFWVFAVLGLKRLTFRMAAQPNIVAETLIRRITEVKNYWSEEI